MTITTDPRLGLPTVYLVDDEDVVRDALAWLLRSRRLLSEGFPSAETFEAMLDGRQSGWPTAPSCLLLDVRMPGTSGLVLFERLIERKLLEALPVIFLTGHGDVPTAVAAVKRGAIFSGEGGSPCVSEGRGCNAFFVGIAVHRFGNRVWQRPGARAGS